MIRKVSIIVPCFNHALYLEECISSVMAQSYTNWECIIIDDGSTDSSSQIAQKLINDKIRYVYQKNQGVSCARNNGIKQATGDYILPLDADDTLNPLALEKMLEVFAKNEETMIVFSDTLMFGHINNKLTVEENFSVEELLLQNKLFCTSMFPKKYFDQGTMYDEKLTGGLEDWEFWIQLISSHRSLPVTKIDYPVFNYRSHVGSSRNNDVFKDDHKKEMIYNMIYEKHKALFHEFYPSYISLLKRKNFYEKKLENIYSRKLYIIYNFLTKLFR